MSKFRLALLISSISLLSVLAAVAGVVTQRLGFPSGSQTAAVASDFGAVLVEADSAYPLNFSFRPGARLELSSKVLGGWYLPVYFGSNLPQEGKVRLDAPKYIKVSLGTLCTYPLGGTPCPVTNFDSITPAADGYYYVPVTIEANKVVRVVVRYEDLRGSVRIESLEGTALIPYPTVYLDNPGASHNNPAYFARNSYISLSTLGPHTAYTFGRAGYTLDAGSCFYPEGGPICTPSTSTRIDPSTCNTPMGCPFTIEVKPLMVTNVVFKFTKANALSAVAISTGDEPSEGKVDTLAPKPNPSLFPDLPEGEHTAYATNKSPEKLIVKAGSCIVGVDCPTDGSTDYLEPYDMSECDANWCPYPAATVAGRTTLVVFIYGGNEVYQTGIVVGVDSRSAAYRWPAPSYNQPTTTPQAQINFGIAPPADHGPKSLPAGAGSSRPYAEASFAITEPDLYGVSVTDAYGHTETAGWCKDAFKPPENPCVPTDFYPTLCTAGWCTANQSMWNGLASVTVLPPDLPGGVGSRVWFRYTANHGDVQISRVGAAETIASAPRGTKAKLDDSPEKPDNPLIYNKVEAGDDHTAWATVLDGYSVSAGWCDYPRGGTPCPVTEFAPVTSQDGWYFKEDFPVVNGRVTRVVFKYSVPSSEVLVTRSAMVAAKDNRSSSKMPMSGTTAWVDSGVRKTDNPARFTDIRFGTHMAKVALTNKTELKGYRVVAGMCEYDLANETTCSTEEQYMSPDITKKNEGKVFKLPLDVTCTSTYCSTESFYVRAGKGVHVEFKFIKKRAIAILVEFKNIKHDGKSDTIESVEEKLNVVDQKYAENSYYNSASWKGLPQGEVVDWVTIPVSIKNNTFFITDAYGWFQKARYAAEQKGYEVDSQDYVYYVLPKNLYIMFNPDGTGGAGGIAYPDLGIFHGNEILINGNEDAQSYIHELGHVLGLGHLGYFGCPADNPQNILTSKCVPQDYAPVTLMGDVGYEDFAAYHKLKLGYIKDSQIQTINKSGTYSISAIDNHDNSNGIKALRLVGGEDGRDYYIEARQSTSMLMPVKNILYMRQKSVPLFYPNNPELTLAFGVNSLDKIGGDAINDIKMEFVSFEGDTAQVKVTFDNSKVAANSDINWFRRATDRVGSIAASAWVAFKSIF